MTEDQFLDNLGKIEGLKYSEPPDVDQPTASYGITLPVLHDYRGHDCTVADLKVLSVQEAREIARWEMRRALAVYRFSELADEHLRVQLVDFAYNSGPERAIRWLQRALGIPLAQATNHLTDELINLVNVTSGVVVNNALVAARLRMLDDVTDTGVVNKRYEEGLASRALSFGVFD